MSGREGRVPGEILQVNKFRKLIKLNGFVFFFLAGLLRTFKVLKCTVTLTRELWDPVTPMPLDPGLICRPECKFCWIRNFSVFPPLRLQSLEGCLTQSSS